jgi:hypothetical protein
MRLVLHFSGYRYNNRFCINSSNTVSRSVLVKGI